MPQNVSLLTSRRSYEFLPDAIRLTVLTIPEHREKITEAFRFEVAGVGTPQPTFAEPVRTIPPGLAFDMGSISVDGELFAIRFIHVEARRIVVDVAGPSRIIEYVYERLRTLLVDMTAPDGQPAVGEHERVLDYSEYVARFDFAPESFVNPMLVALVRQTGMQMEHGQELALVPSLYIVEQASEEVSRGSVVEPLSTMFQFSVRAGSKPGDRMYFSAAPVDSDKHSALLAAIDEALRTSTGHGP